MPAQEGRGRTTPPPLPTDLRAVLLPDGSPDAVKEGGSVRLRVSTEKGLRVLGWVWVRSGPPTFTHSGPGTRTGEEGTVLKEVQGAGK